MLPSEKAYAFDMEMKALYHQGRKVAWYDGPEIKDGDNKSPSATLLSKTRSDVVVADKNSISREMVRRFRRLINLVAELLFKVDNKEIAVSSAVDLSYIPASEQKILLEELNQDSYRITAKKAGKLRKLSEDGKFVVDNIKTILKGYKPEKEKTGETISFKLKRELFTQYFEEGQPKKDIENIIETALEQYFHKV